MTREERLAEARRAIYKMLSFGVLHTDGCDIHAGYGGGKCTCGRDEACDGAITFLASEAALSPVETAPATVHLTRDEQQTMEAALLASGQKIGTLPLPEATANPGGEPSDGAVEAALEAAWPNCGPFTKRAHDEMRRALRAANAFPKPEDAAREYRAQVDALNKATDAQINASLSEGAVDAALLNWENRGSLTRRKAMRAALVAAYAVDFPKPEDSAPVQHETRRVQAHIVSRTTASALPIDDDLPSSGPSLSEGELDRLEDTARRTLSFISLAALRNGMAHPHEDQVKDIASGVLRLIALIRSSKVSPAPSASSGPIQTKVSPGADRPGGTAEPSTEVEAGRGDGPLSGETPSKTGRDPRQSSGPIPTEADLDRLEKIRAAATPGPWQSDWDAVYGGPHNYTIVFKMGTSGPDTDFIAAFNPQAMAPVLSLAREGLRARQAVPEGWKLVPVTLTYEMWEVARSVDDGPSRTYQEHWDMMLAAAPPAPGGK